MPTIFESLRGLSPSTGLGEGWSLFAGLPRAIVRGLFDLFLLWQERAAQRHALAQLDGHALGHRPDACRGRA